MSSSIAAAIYGLTVHPGESATPPFRVNEFPATFRITMAAIDPSSHPASNGTVNGDVPARATLKMIRLPMDDESDEDDDEEDEEDEEDYNMADLLDESESDSDDEAVNGGPSDPEKSPKARKEAMVENFKNAVEEAKDDTETDGINGVDKKNKGKGRAIDEESEESVDDLASPEDVQELVLCTLDPTQHYQQPLDITIPEHENVMFKVTGSFDVYLTGNILLPEDDQMGDPEMGSDSDEDDDDDMYDLDPEDDELDLPDDEDESDELDDMDDPRITEVDTDEEDAAKAPKLIKTKQVALKGKNKRPAEDSADNTPEKPVAKTETLTNGEQPLSKSQLKKQKKKLKDNAGNAVDVTAGKTEEKPADAKEITEASIKASPNGKDKKVSFAKTLVQGPSSSSSPAVPAQSGKKADEPKKADEGKSGKPALGVKTVQGVTVDDKKLGTGPLAKKGDKVAMRYIGKLDETKRVFDCENPSSSSNPSAPPLSKSARKKKRKQRPNKKGEPFSFKLGSGQVIKGWDIGVAGMSAGGERRITIPANLAYGNKKQSEIPANSVLVFDIKMLSINSR
ncbi:MAG: peptidylprolyl isomerase fpr4 [Chrysothrix sp. TS-e1954]|nr:MAG: peptidylprolyl isomerase fpr4 [Chrysothrix sp. TS-e1954]